MNKVRSIAVLAALALMVPLPPARSASAAAPPTSRIAGADRFETAAAIAAHFPPTPQAAYIATGETFPDALAAVPVAIRRNAPVLLVTRDDVPPPTAAALERLLPESIVVVGGEGAVGEGVLAELRRFTTGPVTRLSGPDRYATAVALAGDREPVVPVVYLASGRSFPDALAIGPVAGAVGAPLLLTDPNVLPSSTADALERLRPVSIVVVGGPAAVSDAVVQQLDQFSTQVRRIAGADRYATSVAISASAFTPGVELAFLATGSSFPDALAGAALAGRTDSPVLLSPPDCVPGPVADEVARLTPGGVILFGGTVALSDAVAALTRCGAPVPPPTGPAPGPAPEFVTFGDGTWRVGIDIPPGTYRLRSEPPGWCYWERVSGFGGELDEILGNDLGFRTMVVTIAPTDAGFVSDDCGRWSSDLSPLSPSAPGGPFGDGTWIVGLDVEPGTWRAPGGESCYWERLAAFSGRFSDIIANDFGGLGPIVTIDASDAGFASEDCGVWTRIG